MPSLSSNKHSELNNFAPFCEFLVFWTNSHKGRLLARREAFFRNGRLIIFLQCTGGLLLCKGCLFGSGRLLHVGHLRTST